MSPLLTELDEGCSLLITLGPLHSHCLLMYDTAIAALWLREYYHVMDLCSIASAAADLQYHSLRHRFCSQYHDWIDWQSLKPHAEVLLQSWTAYLVTLASGCHRIVEYL